MQVRMGDPEMLAKIMQSDPYFFTQDNGAGSPLHFAVTYRQLDMAHHLLNNGAAVNQRDSQGWTPLHRAAHLAHLDGYLEIYEYLLSRGADPSILTDDYDPYLDPGRKTPIQVAPEDEDVRARLAHLELRYATVPKAPLPHPDVGDWWALYDYGPEVVTGWPADFTPPYPEVLKRQRDHATRAEERKQRKAALAAARDALAADGFSRPFAGPTASGPSKAADAAAQARDAPTGAARGAPRGKNAFLFPGQGSQAVGMIGEAAAQLPAVREMLEVAKTVLGYDMLELIQKGPKEKLDDTIYAQPALLVANLAAAEQLRARNPAAAAACGAAAGLSLGEYAALVVKIRAESMAAAGRAGSRPHGMLSVVGLPDGELEGICREAAEKLGPGTVCVVANYLFPTGRVVSGHLDALDWVQSAALEAGALKAARLAVSGAFHTSLMEPARAALESALASVKICAPQIPVWSNVTASPFPSDPDSIRKLLGRQLVEPVRWEATLVALTSPDDVNNAGTEGGRKLHELGPGQQIKSMVRRVSGDAWKAMVNASAS
ncbi:(acyl-carrier-protein) S-malonyltransferase [Monoraphidium neglectum]|uniref:(Acyl-carrier-protein) S-malonyltransferase n=1 Tax=Monoraphidium neglectum TaxID=145388 RepID=A0A0D2MXW0_9CHLO|nr:(acyl-carrier-protein) S-malonyltransferase [Monoraphidium neglectum]KIZ07315.1 (acyl-carrier-protein) S-malonyltransferase [Monoraphidium neglectum]|eukprot:XP_013906334.1 (acyl-carrier-protein) S-malonyltransferase [Monoraphidium neglectum]